MNACIVDDQVVYTGPQVAVGDTGSPTAGATYVVLCRAHWRSGQHRPGL